MLFDFFVNIVRCSVNLKPWYVYCLFSNFNIPACRLMVLKISSKFELRRFCRTTGSVAMVSVVLLWLHRDFCYVLPNPFYFPPTAETLPTKPRWSWICGFCFSRGNWWCQGKLTRYFVFRCFLVFLCNSFYKYWLIP